MNDLALLKEVGLSFCPKDAVPLVQNSVDIILSKEGGKAAVREMIDIIMEKDKKEKEQPKEKEMGCGSEKEMGCGGKEMAKDVKVEEPKKFSIETYADKEALMADISDETDENKELAKKVMAMDAKGIIDTVMSFAKENAELKGYKAKREEDDKQKKLAQIMAAVKSDIEPKKFSELQQEGETLTLSDLTGFENKVKAFAYESTKGKEHKTSDVMKFASNEDVFEHTDNSSKLWN